MVLGEVGYTRECERESVCALVCTKTESNC
jgi:hypothetical protein